MENMWSVGLVDVVPSKLIESGNFLDVFKDGWLLLICAYAILILAIYLVSIVTDDKLYVIGSIVVLVFVTAFVVTRPVGYYQTDTLQVESVEEVKDMRTFGGKYTHHKVTLRAHVRTEDSSMSVRRYTMMVTPKHGDKWTDTFKQYEKSKETFKFKSNHIPLLNSTRMNDSVSFGIKGNYKLEEVK